MAGIGDWFVGETADSLHPPLVQGRKQNILAAIPQSGNALPDVGPILLLAASSEAVAMVRRALGEGFSYRVAESLDDALDRLSSDVDLILINVAFDGSRMFDFVRAVRSSNAGPIVPIVCFRHHERPLTQATHHAIELALAEWERISFVDLYALREQGDVAAAMSALRETVWREIRRPGAPSGASAVPAAKP